MRRPPELKAVVTLCSTDDRYVDDVHYMGGCLLRNNLAWGGQSFAYSARPPDPAIVGERWRDMWRDRLENLPFVTAEWMSHPTRDAYWRHGSVNEDWGRHPVPGLCGDRMGGRLHEHRTQADGRAQGTAPLPDRAVGPRLSAHRGTRSGDRFSAGDAALVGPLAEGRG